MRPSVIHPDDRESAFSMFRRLVRMDPMLRLQDSDAHRLDATRLAPSSYSSDQLFSAIATQSPVLFDDFPSPIRDPDLRWPKALEHRLASSTSKVTHPVRFGSGDAKRDLTLAGILRRWQVPGAIMGVTDLPVRDGELENIFDTDFLAPWNLMAKAPPAIQRLEMLTAVLSTAGKLTDSHSDDMAVCNHCCTGLKLWLAWDTYEGLQAGLEDVERVSVTGRARFDMATFLSLDSACWFLVGPGQTIFLPGKYTHRVYTLNNYIGVGSFYVGPANLLHTVARWVLHGSLWDDEDPGALVDTMLTTGLEALAKLQNAGPVVRKEWGCAALPKALAHFEAWATIQDIPDAPKLKMTAEMVRRLCEI